LQRTCTKCGFVNPPEHDFCPGCESRLPKAPKRRAGWDVQQVVLMVLVVGLVAEVLWVAFNPPGHRADTVVSAPLELPTPLPQPVRAATPAIPASSKLVVTIKDLAFQKYTGQRVSSEMFLDGQPVDVSRDMMPDLRVAHWTLTVANPTTRTVPSANYRVWYLNRAGRAIPPEFGLDRKAAQDARHNCTLASAEHVSLQLAPGEDCTVVLDELVSSATARYTRNGSVSITPLWSESATAAPQASSGRTPAAFDVPSLVGLNIDQVKAALGPPDDDTEHVWPDPDDDEDSKEWSKPGDKMLIVTFHERTRQVNEFFVSTDSSAGYTSDRQHLLDMGNLRYGDSRYDLEFTPAGGHPGAYTGVKAFPTGSDAPRMNPGGGNANG